MPGHNPAGTTPPAPLTAAPGSADVIALAGRRTGHLKAVEEAPMTGATPAPVPDERLAIAIQALYIGRRMSLADPDTADAYRVALEAVTLLILDGAYRTGGLGEGEHRRLRALLDAAQLVPDYVTGTHTG